MSENSQKGSLLSGLLVFLSVLVVAAAVYALMLSEGNVALKERIDTQQRQIAEAVNLSKFNNQLIKALAGVAAQTNDVEIRDMLAAQGVTYEVTVNAETEQAEED